jgi:hypothetical protein
MTVPPRDWPGPEWLIPAKVKIIFTITKIILTFAGTLARIRPGVNLLW